MKVKTFVSLVGSFTIAAVAYAVHSQISPKPLPSFLVQSTMSSPKAGSPYPEISAKGFAVRSDGSWVLITYGNRAGLVSHIRDIYDVVNNIHTTIEDLSKSIQTRAMSESESSIKRVSASTSCGGSAAGQMLDLKVEYKQEKGAVDYGTDGPVTSIINRWLAPDLGCFALKKETIWTRERDGVVLVDTTDQAISVSFQTVDQFFDIPAGYTERTPGEVFLELSRLYPDQFPPPGDTSGIDEAYRIAHGRLQKH
jgi:hypothetical protein